MKRVLPLLFFLCFCLGGLYSQQLQHTQKVSNTPQNKFSPYDGAKRWESNKEMLPGNLQAFVENKGEFVNNVNDWKVLYGCDYQGTRIMFTDKGVIYSMPESIKLPTEADNGKDGEEQEKVNTKVIFHNVAIAWENADAGLTVEAVGERSYYFGFADPVNIGKSIDHAKGFEKLVYHNVYPGIDIEYTFHKDKGIEYAVIVKAGYSAAAFKMLYSGQDGLSIDSKGDIHMATALGDIIDHAPISTQGGAAVESSFKKLSDNEIGFTVSNVNPSVDLIIDPWTVYPTTGGFTPVDVDMDVNSNTYIYGGTAISFSVSTYEQQYSPAGALVWTYAYSMYGPTEYLADMAVDAAGNSYVAAPYTYSNANFMQYALVSVNSAGIQKYFFNTYSRPADPPYDGIFETWNLAFSCDHNTVIEAGAYEYSTYQVAVMNPATGNVYSIDSGSINTSGEVYAGCVAPNGNYYAITGNQVGQDSLYCFNITGTKVTTKWSLLTSYTYYDYSGKSPVGIGTNGIAAGCAYLYTMNGTNLDQRSLTTGAIIKHLNIPTGDSTYQTGGYGTSSSGIAVDLSCGYVYVGTVGAVNVYDQNLNPVTTVATPGGATVYGVTYQNGLISATGYDASNTGFVMQFNAQKCKTSLTITSTNTTCGQNNGTATCSTPTFCAAPYSYLWTPSGQTNQTATNLGPGTYTVHVTTASACVDVQDTVTILPSKPMTLTATVTSSGACSSNLSATVTGGVAPYIYLWSTGATSTALTGVGSGTYTIYATDSAGGCKDSATVTVAGSGATIKSTTVNESCFGGTNASGTLTVTGGTGPFSYSWSTGATSSSVNNLAAGSYSCVVTDKGTGCKDTVGIVIIQPTQLRDSITNIVPSLCSSANGSATVGVAGGSGGYTYSWAPSGGTNATANNLAGGIYTVTVTDKNGCTNTATANVPSTGGFRDSVVNTVNVLCFGGNNGSITVGVTGGVAPYTYTWNTGKTGATVSTLSAGTYTITITDGTGCKMLLVDSITQPKQLLASTGAGPTICIGQTAVLTGNATGGTPAYTYLWDATTTGSTYSVNPVTTTTYTVQATDNNGCTAKSTVTVTVNPPLSVVASPPQTVCPGGSITLTANGKGGDGTYTYTWYPPATGTVGQTIKVSPAVTTTYTVVINDACGTPVAKDSVTITVNPLPTVAFVPDTLNGCYPQCIKFTDLTTILGGTLQSWSWTFGDGGTDTIQNSTHCYTKPGVYSVGLTVTSNKGCTSKLNVPNLITIYDHPHANFVGSPQPADIMQPFIQFTDKTTDAYGIISWFWTFGDATDSTSSIENPGHTYRDTGTFCPTLVVTNIHQCTDSIEHCIIIDPLFTLYIPNAFTPNNDNRDDIFLPKGIYVCTFEMWIFDRWGQEIFHTTDINQGWNGHVGNSSAMSQEDTYVYKINATDCEHHNNHSYVGRVTLLK